MRTHHTAVLLTTAGLLALTACQDLAASGGTPAPHSSSGLSASSKAPGSAAKTATVPQLVGKGLQSAQDESQAAGFALLKSHDALGRGRLQAVDRNWKVCSQSPVAGATVPTGTTLDFGAVKLEESCPAADPGPQPEAGGTMPDLAGKSMKVARAALPSNTGITVKDAAQSRMVLQESNWKVCSQDPKAGTRLAGQPVAFTVVKFAETCP
ncbi:PASTA domain-containing protein [Streptomyces sp. NBC_01343]|uniref:PASTA domain-containing protein n=1 Tax=Streptomyces sp. NBC_01343 TaxID=2903832 RepID=UPI002E11C2FF|nr:PASTA domain-containing protein [Streptomyces sp. NBC_01343]